MDRSPAPAPAAPAAPPAPGAGPPPPPPPADRVRVWASPGAGEGVRADVPLAEISDLLADPDALVWVDLFDPHPDTLAALHAECRLHPLAIEDADKHHQRPKIDEYDTFYFLVFYAVLTDPAGGTARTAEVDLFIGDRFLVTVHDDPIPEIEHGVRRWRQNDDDLGHSIGALLYALLDGLVDAYFPALDAMGDRVEAIQEEIFDRPTRGTLQALSHLRRDLLALRRVLAPQREVINTLLRRDRPILPVAATPYFHDVYDHIVRLIDTIDTHRDLLGAATDSYLSVTSNNLNEVMKTMAAWSIILMSGALIAGIYGMNFAVMPELAWQFGYPLALGLILAVGLVLYRHFQRRGWL